MIDNSMSKNNFVIPPSGIRLVGISALVLRDGVKNGLKIIDAIKPITEHMYNKAYFKDQKFVRIGILFLYRIKTDLKPRYERINRTYKDLPISIELGTEVLRWADRHDHELMKDIFLIATCKAVLDVLHKYKLPTGPVEKVRATLGDIPQSVEEIEAHPDLYTVPLAQPSGGNIKEH
jgi:hypothetical protein